MIFWVATGIASSVVAIVAILAGETDIAGHAYNAVLISAIGVEIQEGRAP